MIKGKMEAKTRKFIGQRLFKIHIALGISLALFLYVSIFFGIWAIFQPYIEAWEKPSRCFAMTDIGDIDYEPMIDDFWATSDLPKNKIHIDLPGYKKDPALRIFHQFGPKNIYNPLTGKRINDEGDQSGLALFLTGLHYGKPLKKMGLVFFKTGLVFWGIISVGGMLLTLGGLLLIYMVPFRGSWNSLQNIFSKFHRVLCVAICPVFILILLCAAVMGVGIDGASPVVYMVTKGQQASIKPLVGPLLFPEEKSVPILHKPAKMLPIRELIQKAQNINPDINFEKLVLTNWHDKSARIRLEGYNPYRPFLNGVTNHPSVTLTGRDGELIEQVKVGERSWAMLLTDGVYFLHLLFGVNIFVRLLIAFFMVLACVAMGCGVLLWLEKKARKYRQKIVFYHWLGKLSLTVMVGVIPATGLLFNLQWLLPFDLENRLTWQQGLFFDFWLAALAWSFYRLESFRAAKEFLGLGSILFATAPICHFFFFERGAMNCIDTSLLHIVLVDTGLILLAIFFCLIAFFFPKTREDAKKLWIRQKQ